MPADDITTQASYKTGTSFNDQVSGAYSTTLAGNLSTRKPPSNRCSPGKASPYSTAGPAIEEGLTLSADLNLTAGDTPPSKYDRIERMRISTLTKIYNGPFSPKSMDALHAMSEIYLNVDKRWKEVSTGLQYSIFLALNRV
jgi:hypothetical protein